MAPSSKKVGTPAARFPASTPRAQSLPALTERWLKSAISSKKWEGHLPSERLLALDLQVSRSILRAALSRLEKEGWIRKQPRAKTLILRKGRARPPQPPRRLVLLSTHALESRSTARTLSFYRKILRDSLERRFQLIEIHDHRLEKPAPAPILEQYIAENPGGVWVLIGVSEEVQRHFERRNLPAVILGHRFPGVRLCAVDMDANAACWHAVTQLQRAGCRTVMLFLVDTRRAGDLAAQEGFHRAVGEGQKAASRVCVIRRVEQVETQLESIRPAASRPAGFVVMNPTLAIPLVCGCLSRGYRLGRDVHIISVYEDPILGMFPGKIPHYSRTNLNGKLSELVLRALRGEVLKPKEHLFVPEYIGPALVPP